MFCNTTGEVDGRLDVTRFDSHRVSDGDLGGDLLLPLSLTGDVVEGEEKVVALAEVGGEFHLDLLVEVGRPAEETTALE